MEYFHTHPVFSSLQEGERDSLARQALRRELTKEEVLALQGDVWPYLFLVAEGTVDAIKISSEGRNLLVTSFSAGELFWGPAFFQEGVPLPATLLAHCPSQIYLWSRAVIEPLILANGRMSWELCRLMVQRMQRASAIVDELAFQPVAGRLARLLLDYFEKSGEKTLTRYFTLDEMAARVGTTREIVCRTLYRFADQRLIEVTRTELALVDKAGLVQIAEGE